MGFSFLVPFTFSLGFQVNLLSFVCINVGKKVTNLRQRFFNSTAPGGLAGDRRDVVPASGFSFNA